MFSEKKRAHITIIYSTDCHLNYIYKIPLQQHIDSCLTEQLEEGICALGARTLEGHTRILPTTYIFLI